MDQVQRELHLWDAFVKISCVTVRVEPSPRRDDVVFGCPDRGGCAAVRAPFEDSLLSLLSRGQHVVHPDSLDVDVISPKEDDSPLERGSGLGRPEGREGFNVNV
jgi:hypothetical protein